MGGFEFFRKKDPLGQVGSAEGILSEKIHRGEVTKNEPQPARFVRDDVTYEGHSNPRHESPEVLEPVNGGERMVIGGIDISAYEDPNLELNNLKSQYEGLIAEGRVAEAGFVQAKMNRISSTAPTNPEGNLMEDLDFGKGAEGAEGQRFAA